MKTAIYVRVSTEEQAKEGYSISAQINLLAEYAKLNNFEIYNIYKDEGLSGRTNNRPALNQMLNDAKNKSFDVVLVWKISRLSRNLKNLLNIVDILECLGISFISQSETFNTLNPIGKMTLQILGSIAEFERNTIVDNIKLGLNEKAKRGEWLGGRVFGYKSENKKLVVDNKQAKIIKEIFNQYNQSHSLYKVTKNINKKGYKTNNNKEFTQTSIYRILSNPIYIGYLRHNTNKDNFYLIKGKHKAIISKKMYFAIQKSFPLKRVRNHVSEYILSGLLKCPYCQSNLFRYKTSKYRYYRCGTYHNHGKDKCKGFLINADYIEEEIFERIKKIIKNPSVTKYIYDILKISDVFEDDFSERIKELECEKQRDIIRLLISEIYVGEDKKVKGFVDKHCEV